MRLLALSLLLASAPDEALRDLDAARAAGELDPAALRDNWVARAKLLAERGDGDGAERALSVALRVDRDLELDEGLGLLGPILDEARAALPPPERALHVELTRADDAVVARLVADDLGLVHGAELELADDDVRRFPLTREQPEARVPGVGSALGEVAVFLLDEHGNVLGGRRAALSASRAPVDAAASSSTLEVTGSALAILGAAGLAGCAAGVVVVEGGPPQDREPLRTLFLTGTFVSAGLGAAGIVLAAADRLLGAEP